MSQSILELSAAARQPVRPGHYSIEYTDRTHLEAGTWIKLLNIDVYEPIADWAPAIEDDVPIHLPYRVELDPQVPAGFNEFADRFERTLLDLLAQVLVKIGLLQPRMTPETFRQVIDLKSRKSVLLAPDTNALTTGTLYWLLRGLRGVTVWLSPLAISLAQAQQRAEKLKHLSFGDPKKSEGPQALRSRNLVNSALSALERFREQYLIVEVDPQLLRYARPSGKGSSDPDQTDYLEDRLLIETVHQFFPTIRSHIEKLVVTSDTLLARILNAEGIESTFLQIPVVKKGTTFGSSRFDCFSQRFEGGPLMALLWELCHVFGSVRLVKETNAVFINECYWAEKTVIDWRRERLQMTAEPPAGLASPPTMPAPPTLPLSAPPSGTPPSTEKNDALSLEAHMRSFGFAQAALPEVSPLALFRTAAQIGVLDMLTASDLAESLKQSEKVTARAIETLARASLIGIDPELQLIARTEDLISMLEALTDGNLDRVSKYFESNYGYSAYLNAISDLGRATTKQLYQRLRRSLGQDISESASDRFRRIPESLGQVWGDGNNIFYGAKRPSKREVEDAFNLVFQKTSHDGAAQLRDILAITCQTLQTSPWWLQRQLPLLIAEGFLAKYIFQPSAGSGKTAKYSVISMDKTSGVRELDVYLDRVIVSDRPIFSVIRKHAS